MPGHRKKKEVLQYMHKEREKEKKKQQHYELCHGAFQTPLPCLAAEFAQNLAYMDRNSLHIIINFCGKSR